MAPQRRLDRQDRPDQGEVDATSSTTGGTQANTLALCQTENNSCNEGDDTIIPSAIFTGGYRLWAPRPNPGANGSNAGGDVYVNLNRAANPGGAVTHLSVPPTDTDVAVAGAAADMTPPSSPTSLATSVTATSVTLSWSAASDNTAVTGYRIYKWTAAPAGVHYTPKHEYVTTVSGTSYTDTSVVQGTTYYYDVRAIDAATNIGPRSTTSATPFDDGPPVTTAGAPVSSTQTSGWVNTSSVSFLLTPDDLDGTPPSVVYYSIDGAAQVSQPYLGLPILVSLSGLSDGSHSVVYYSVDTAGKTETAQTGYINVDTTGPTVTAAATVVPSSWSKTDVTVTVHASDAGSGIASVEYRVQGASTWESASGTSFTVPALANHANDGAVVYEYRAVDAVGNSGGTATCTVSIDTTKPVTTATEPPADLAGGSHSTPVDVALHATDGGSGVAKISYAVDGGATADTAGDTASAHIPAGVHTLTYWSTDNAGNVEDVNSLAVQVVGVAPVTTDDAPTAWQSHAVTVTLTASNSGGITVAHTYYKVDAASSWTDGTSIVIPAPSNGTNDGVHTIQYYSVNSQGYAEDPAKSCTVKIDTQAPETTAWDAPTDWQSASPVTVHLTPQDAPQGSGVASTLYSTDAGAHWTAYTAAGIQVTAQGATTILFYSTDNASPVNTEPQHSITVNLDTVAPVISGVVPADQATYTLGGSDAVAWTATDGTSGVISEVATIDGAAVNKGASLTGSLSTGLHTFVLTVTDNAGNQSVVSNTFHVTSTDTTAPTTSNDAPADPQNNPVTVHLTATDNAGGSGVAATRYSTDGGATFVAYNPAAGIRSPRRQVMATTASRRSSTTQSTRPATPSRRRRARSPSTPSTRSSPAWCPPTARRSRSAAPRRSPGARATLPASTAPRRLSTTCPWTSATSSRARASAVTCSP